MWAPEGSIGGIVPSGDYISAVAYRNSRLDTRLLMSTNACYETSECQKGHTPMPCGVGERVVALHHLRAATCTLCSCYRLDTDRLLLYLRHEEKFHHARVLRSSAP
jgi:hypothetical protein